MEIPPRRPLLRALGWGALSALALPPLHLLPVLLLALPALLRLLGHATDWRRALALGVAFGWGHHAAGLYWVTHALFTDIGRWWWLVPLAAPGLALPLAGFTALAVLAAWWAPAGWRRVAAFSGAWVLAELLRGWAFTGFPWNLLGTAWAFHALPLQPAAVIGTHGLSLLTVVLACVPLLGWRWRVGGVAVLSFWMAFGAWRLAGPEVPAQPLRVVLVQGNVGQDVKWDADQRLPIFRRYLALTEAALAPLPADAPVAVVWPETASPFLLADDAAARQMAAAALRPGALLLAGSMRAEWDAQGRLRRVFNSLVGVGPDAEVVVGYDKHHLVPFGEYMPLGGLVPIRIVVGGMDFSAGPGPATLAPPGIPPFSPLICYEVIFPGRVAARPRPAWLLNVTNDAWFGMSAGPYQHLAAARLRAVEEGLPLLRAAQTGISAAFDGRGREVARLGLGEVGSLTVALPGPEAPTWFTEFRLATPALLALMLWLLGIFRDRGRVGTASV